MGRTCRRGESVPLVPHGRRSAVRPQVCSGCAVFSVGFVLAILAITMIRREAHGWKPIGRRRRLSKTDHTVSRATRSTSACSWASPVLRWAFIGAWSALPHRCGAHGQSAGRQPACDQINCCAFLLIRRPAKLIRGMTGYGTGRGPGAAFPITALAPTASVASAAVDASTARHNRPHRSSCLSSVMKSRRLMSTRQALKPIDIVARA